MSTNDEAERVRQAEVERFGILDTPEEQAYDDLTRMAASICDVPIALITVLDRDRNWFKSRIGMQQSQSPRAFAFCEHMAHSPGDLLVVADASIDPRFSKNPQVVGDPNIRFYAGAPLVSANGQMLGALCVIDVKPRELDAKQIETLQFLARQVMDKLEERRRALDAGGAGGAPG